MKLKETIIDNLNCLLAKEWALFIYLIRRQNQSDGRVEGVYYRDVMKETGMCKQSFYNALRGLESKQVISVTRGSDKDYNVQIRGNAFPTNASYSEGYVKLNRRVFRSRRFKALKAHEKYMLFEFLKCTHEGRGSWRIGVKRLYEKFTKLLGVTERTIREYLHSLRKFFSIGIKDGKYYITYLHSVFQDGGEKAEDTWHYEHLVKKECWRNHVTYDETSLKETAFLVKQYRQLGGGAKALIRIVMLCIQKSVEGVERRDRTLQYKYIHKLVKGCLDLP